MRLRELREKRNFLPADVAYALGVSVSTYLQYEDGSLELDAKTLLRLAVIFNCSTDEILGLSKKKPAPNPKPSYPRYQIPTDDGESPTRKPKSCLTKLVLVLLIIVLSLFVWEKVANNSFSACKSKVEKATSREIRNSDLDITPSYDFPISIVLTATAHSDIRDLTLKIEYLNSSGKVLKTSYETFGDIDKGESKTRTISLTSFSWSVLNDIASCHCEVESGYVPLL